MIRRFALVLAVVVLSVGAVLCARAATFALTDGTTLEGDPISPNAQGLVVRKADGSFANRVGWTNFTQEALKEFVKLQPKSKAFVEPYLEEDEADAEKAAAPVIKLKDHPRMERPDPKAGMGSLFSSTLTLVLLLLVYAGNIYAGFEIGIFRNYHPGMVAGIAAVAPVIGPVIFLCLPTRIQKSLDELGAESMAEHGGEVTQLSYVHPGSKAPTPEEQAAQEAAAAQAQVTVYQRGKTTFNRRFFETKFSGFLKAVPGDAEKDKEIYVKSARGEYVTTHLTRVEANEVIVQVQKGGATADVIVPFGEIVEIQVRPRGS
ncbi:MAG: hypothetical protein IPK15_22680 [Verrucomicrobia bacterium]|nr:hypothetical protein [Verrucomicrobiota bacterium]